MCKLQALPADENQMRNDNKDTKKKKERNNHVKRPSQRRIEKTIKMVSKTNCSVLNVVVSSMPSF